MDVPIIFLTGYSSQTYIERAKEVGPPGYMLNPVQSGQIIAAIEIPLHNRINRRIIDEARPISNQQLRSSHLTLAKREIQIAGLIIQGMDTGEMVLFLLTSPETISWHRYFCL